MDIFQLNKRYKRCYYYYSIIIIIINALFEVD